jgi:hypothetical protein
MGIAVLREVLLSWGRYELDDSVYLPAGAGEAQLDMEVEVLPFDPHRRRIFEDKVYLRGIEQIRDAIEGLEAQLGRSATATERLRATTHRAQHDAFIDPNHARDEEDGSQ